MELKRLDDSQSWALAQGGKRLLIDPWLTGEWSLPPGHWLFGRTRNAPTPGGSGLATRLLEPAPGESVTV